MAESIHPDTFNKRPGAFTVSGKLTPPQELVIKRVSNGFTVGTPPNLAADQRTPHVFAVAETVESLVAQLKKWGKDVQ